MNEEIINSGNAENEEICEDSTEALLEKYDRKKAQKTDDIPAMQAVVCILLAAAFFGLNIAAPELSKPIFDYLKKLSCDEREIIPNLIDMVISLWSKL